MNWRSRSTDALEKGLLGARRRPSLSARKRTSAALPQRALSTPSGRSLRGYPARMSNYFEWDGDWQPVEGEQERTQLEEELRRELPSSHVLKGVGAVALGRRWRRDDVLFRLDDGRFAQVHLTWSVETDPRWPDTQIFATFEAWKSVPLEDR